MGDAKGEAPAEAPAPPQVKSEGEEATGEEVKGVEMSAVNPLVMPSSFEATDDPAWADGDDHARLGGPCAWPLSFYYSR